MLTLRLFTFQFPFSENPDQVDNKDECAEDNGGCTHTCQDTEEAYECLCPDNMYLEADNKTCASMYTFFLIFRLLSLKIINF